MWLQKYKKSTNQRNIGLKKCSNDIFATKLQNFHPIFAPRNKTKKRWHTNIIIKSIATTVAHMSTGNRNINTNIRVNTNITTGTSITTGTMMGTSITTSTTGV